ncbi:MAG: hypothetical protein ACI93L_003319 [Cyclobacteriaceae bacterium]|jgi:hypothetical protein
MRRKLISIPVPSHIKKFLICEYSYKDGIIHIQHRVIPPKYSRSTVYRKYFQEPNPDFIYIDVLTEDSKLYKLYGWINHIRERFTQRMVDYAAARYALQSTRKSIREFLVLYNITESEYAFDTAYKNWQRSKTYKHLRIQYPNYGRNRKTLR